MSSNFLGLNARQQPAPLLRTIKGRRENFKDLEDMATSGKANLKEPLRDDAPPLSSDEEDNAAYDEFRGDSSDSDNDRRRTAEIQPSFSRESRITQEKELPPKNQSLARKTPDDVQPSLAGVKRPADSMSDDYMKDPIGFIKVKRVSKTFGSTSRKSIQSQANVSPTRPKFKTPKPVGTPSPGKGAGPRNNFTQHSVGSSPSKTPAKREFKRNFVLDSSPEKPQKGFICPEVNSNEDPPRAKRPARGMRNSKQTRKNDKSPPEESEDANMEEQSPLHEFKTHFLEGFDDLDDVPDDASRPVLSTQQVKRILDPAGMDLNSDSDLSSLDDELFPQESRCPMCHDLVDPELLRQHTAKGRMNIKKQTAFCRLHKRKEAEIAQKTKGYPEIDWSTLELRFKKHTEAIKTILDGGRPSHYADILSERVEAGENRTLLRTDENMTPGYYGPRGLRVMAEFIMRTFSDTLRKRAIEDRLVSSRGYSGYVQAVLVPELAVRLIMDDMSVGEEGARKIMSESSDVGELVHEETRDVVRQSDGEED